MAEFQRRGHWRTLRDGSRTWVSGHDVLRTRQVVHGIDDATVKRRIAEAVKIKQKREEAKRKKRALQKMRRAKRKAKQSKSKVAR